MWSRALFVFIQRRFFGLIFQLFEQSLNSNKIFCVFSLPQQNPLFRYPYQRIPTDQPPSILLKGWGLRTVWIHYKPRLPSQNNSRLCYSQLFHYSWSLFYARKMFVKGYMQARDYSVPCSVSIFFICLSEMMAKIWRVLTFHVLSTSIGITSECKSRSHWKLRKWFITLGSDFVIKANTQVCFWATSFGILYLWQVYSLYN